MTFLPDEMRPINSSDIFFHQSIYDRLLNMCENQDFPHMCIYGEEGAGKGVLIDILLKKLYGNDINNIHLVNYNICGSSNKTKSVSIQTSKYHIVLKPTGMGSDSYLIHDVVKKYAETKTLDLTQNPNSKFRTILIPNIDKLAHNAQTSLRRIIEVNSNTCRFIVCCENLNNLIDPLKSRFICVRVPRPKVFDLYLYIKYIDLIKHHNLSNQQIDCIIKYSQCNIKKVLWCIQLSMMNIEFLNNYDYAINEINDLIFELNFSKIEQIRDIIFNIMITNFSNKKILTDLMISMLKKNINDNLRIMIIQIFSQIDQDIDKGRRAIYHFDLLVIKLMKCIDEYYKTTSEV